MGVTVTIEEIRERFDRYDCELITKEYQGSKGDYDFICRKHLDKGIQNTKIRNLNRGNCCHYCGAEKSRFSRTPNNEELKKLTESKGYGYIGSEFMDGKTYILFYCKSHIEKGQQKMSLTGMRRNKGKCNYCLGRNRSHEEFVELIKSLNENIKILSTYKNSDDIIKCECLIDGNIWENSAKNLIQGQGCRICYNNTIRERCIHTQDWFADKINEIHNGRIYAIDNYDGIKNYLKFKCSVCGDIWVATPDSVINNETGCPKCKKSQGEIQIAKILSSLDIRYTEQKQLEGCRNINPLRFDFYLDDFNICIEYDGEQHFKPIAFSSKNKMEDTLKLFENQKKRDSIKNEYCKINNMILIRIPYYEKDNIERILLTQFYKLGIMKNIS